MDVAASVIAIVEISANITVWCVQYVRDVAHEAEQATSLCQEVGALQIVLARLQSPAVSGETVRQLEAVLKLCLSDVSDLRKKLEPAQGWRRTQQKLVWPFKRRAEFKVAMEKIQRHVSLFTAALSVDLSTLPEQISEHINTLSQLQNSHHAEVLTNFDNIRRTLDDTHLHDLQREKESSNADQLEETLKWLKVVDYDSNFIQNLELLHPQTGKWFTQSRYYQNWLDLGSVRRKNVWLCGQAGAGKTVLMSAIVGEARGSVQALQDIIESGPKVCIAYFYFDFRDHLKRVSQNMLYSILHQLAIQSSSFPQSLVDMKKRGVSHDSVSLSELTAELIRICADFDHPMLFLDALDESQDLPELLNVLKELTVKLPRISIIVSSRDELEIKRGIETLGFDRFLISTDSVDSDIASYVKEVVEKDEKSRFSKFPESLKQLVVSNLTANSQGMFRWAQCQVDEVSRCRSVKEVHETLATLPKTLNETYQRMLENMNESEKKWAKRALIWLVGARYPMTLGMLTEAVAIDLQSFDIDDDDRLFDPEQILDVCRSLVTIVEEPYEPKCRIISLAHFSVEQYLRSREAAVWFLPSAYVELCLAKACLAYSVSPIWEPIYERLKKEEEAEAIAITDTVRFAEYCCVYLFEHLQGPGVENAALPFLLNIIASDKFKNYKGNCAIFQVLADLQRVLLGHQDRTATLQRDISLELGYTSSFVAKSIMYDLSTTALKLIDLDVDTATVDVTSSSAISFLTAKGAIIHIRRLIAVTRKKLEVIAPLDPAETEPAFVQSAIKIIGMGLLVAIAADEDEIMNILIDELLHYIVLFREHRQLGSKIGKIISIGAILSSAEGNMNALVRFLQIGSHRKGLNQCEEELVQQALFCACKHGRQDCVSYLLGLGCQPKMRVLSPRSEDLLYATHDELLKVATRSWLSYCDSLYQLELLDDYHDRGIKTYPCAAESNALEAALQENHTSIAQMLMDVGMSVPSKDSAGESIDLINASEKKDLNTMKALLSAGADPNMEMERSRLRTPLIAALSKGWEQSGICYAAVLELLQHGADITKQAQGVSHSPKFRKRIWGMQPGSPFMCAIEACGGTFGREKSEAEDIFKLLEGFNALQEINRYVPSDDFGTPLIAAAALGQTWVVDYLLNHGAQANLQGHPTSEWCFPALAAIYGGHPELSLRLLEHEGYESLELAPEKWAKGLIFVCAQGDYNSPSSWEELFTALFDRGVDPNYIADIDDDWYDGYDNGDCYEAPALYGNAMIAACTSGRLPIVKALLEKGADKKAPFARPYGTFLAAACGSGNVELVKFFVDEGYDVNEITAHCRYWCPLVAAVCSENYETREVVELLLERGAMADVQYQSANGVVSDGDLETMICSMRKSWHHTLMLFRMWQDCRITGASPIRRHPLFLGSPFLAAVDSRKVDAMKSLATHGADVNMEVRAGFYPTGMLATLDMKKAYKVQHPLVDLGATPISPSQMLDYPSPFRALFSKSDHFENSALLTRPGSFWGSMLTLAVNIKVAVPYLLEQNADPDEVIPGSFYGSAMVAAAALLQAHAVLAFLEKGGGVNKIASEGAFGTPLIAVCAGPPEYPFKYSFHEQYNLNDPEEWEQGQLDLLDILLDAGADPNLTYGSLSPLIALVCSTSTKKIHGVKMLLEHGADPSIALPRYSFEVTSTAENSDIVTPRWTAGYLAGKVIRLFEHKV